MSLQKILIVLLTLTGLLVQSTTLAQQNITVRFVNDYPDTYHLALIIYTPDGKSQTRVSNLPPGQSKTYSLPIGSSVFIADYKQEAYAMQGKDIRESGFVPLLVLNEKDRNRSIQLSSLGVNKLAKGLAGIWQFNLGEQDIVQRINLQQKGDSLCGTFFGQAFCTVMKEGKMQFKIADYVYTGRLLNNETIEGTFLDREGTIAQWKAIREKISSSPKSYTFEPIVFYRNYSSLAQPALHLFSSDTVRTSTVDASGTDKDSKKRTWGGNPLTGPFYIENAMPGDVVAIHFISVKTNRHWAYSGRSIIDNALETNYLLSKNNAVIDNAWIIDTVAQNLRMESPSVNLKQYRIPLTPFLGCVGLAPSLGTGASSRESGVFGGNMEEKSVQSGNTLFLPVAVQGAYLYLGDGHAAQGDGELTGNAMETSMDVQFTVELIRNRSHIPRIETAGYIKSIGIAATLDQAMKMATTDLTRWLQTSYQLTEPEAAMLMGFSVEFSIPDLVGSNVGVSARISKQVLNGLLLSKLKPSE
jgi:acetamidase/formamidase